MNELAIILAKRFEGYAEKVYFCPSGIPTSGWGHAWQKGEFPRSLNIKEAEEFLIRDLLISQNALYKLSPVIIRENESRQAALIDFIFNLGSGRYSASTLRRKVNQLDWQGAKKQIVKWVFATNPKTGKVGKLKGLIIRRAIEAFFLY